MISNQITHVLRNRLPLCEFSIEPPIRWPEGHKYVFVIYGLTDPDYNKVTCPDCKDKLKKLFIEKHIFQNIKD